MGRDWLHWGGGGGRATRRARNMAPEDNDPGGGCVCAVFQFFDLHPFQFPSNQQQPDSTIFLNHEEANLSKGTEAPRNSLETEEAMNREQSLNFPGGLQIKTRVSTKSGTEEICSNSSPGTSVTTPSLVARLMGLEVLPQCSSPSSASSNSRPLKKSSFNQRKERNILGRRSNRSFSDDDISVGVRSLPETPRVSLGRRSDVECHRLSLNVNKENVNDEFVKRWGRSKQDEDRSPGYAKQIVNRVRESVSRRVGLDITNINRDTIKVNVMRRDENLILLKSTKNHFKALPSLEEGETRSDEAKSLLRLSDIKKNKQATKSTSTSCHKGISDPSKSNNKAIMQEHYRHRNHRSNETFPPQAIRNNKEEQFVHSRATDKKPKKAPFSRELLNTSGPTPLPVKKAPSPPATKLPQKQTQDPPAAALASKRNTQLCNSKKSYPYDLLQPISAVQDSNNRRGAAAATEYRPYIERILKRAGIIDGVTSLKLGKWHTPSHPLDPSVFYYLELFHPAASGASTAAISRRCNRKLIFHLVDELLAEILKPHLEFKPRSSQFSDHRFGLIDELCKKIERFPGANCLFLEDIDSLMHEDLVDWEFLDEERAKLAHEIEGEIMDSLLRETVTFLASVARNNRDRTRWVSRGLPRE